MRECGLKQLCILASPDINLMSLPMRECGLKLLRQRPQSQVERVTPHAGVWIETDLPNPYQTPAACHSPCGSVD